MASWNGLTGFEFTAEEKKAIHESYIDVVFKGDYEAYKKHEEEEERLEAIGILVGYVVIMTATIWKVITLL